MIRSSSACYAIIAQRYDRHHNHHLRPLCRPQKRNVSDVHCALGAAKTYDGSRGAACDVVCRGAAWCNLIKQFCSDFCEQTVSVRAPKSSSILITF